MTVAGILALESRSSKNLIKLVKHQKTLNHKLKKLLGYAEDIETDGKKSKTLNAGFSLALVAPNIFLISINKIDFIILGASIGFWALTIIIQKYHKPMQIRINNFWDKRNVQL